MVAGISLLESLQREKSKRLLAGVRMVLDVLRHDPNLLHNRVSRWAADDLRVSGVEEAVNGPRTPSGLESF